MVQYDVVIIGAGAAGLFCAGIAGQLGLQVMLIDHMATVAEKIRISGGGRCNFTNRDAGPASFLSANPHFCRSALARYGAHDFIALLQHHRIAFHEKHKGQLFCDHSAEDVIAMLLRECDAGGVVRWQPCQVAAVRHGSGGFEMDTDRGPVRASKLVVASGGLSIPKIGASDFGYRLARQFGHRIVETRPALVPLTFSADEWRPFAPLAGLSLPVRVSTGSGRSCGQFLEDLLFTHRGLSGPAILQISSYWRSGDPIELELLPGMDLGRDLLAAKAASKRSLGNTLAQWLPRRLAEAWFAESGPMRRTAGGLSADRPLAEWRDRDLQDVARSLQGWTVTPNGTEGYRKAEVTAGGVDTRQLNSSTMASQLLPDLYFIGEVVDVTGWLGGYNFQWAWSSAAVCAGAMSAAARQRG